MLLNGINHVAVLTKDTDRLHAFYREVFDAEVFSDRREDVGRLSFVTIGPHTQLNVFEVAGNTEADRQVPMFGRGRIDHLGLEAASQEAFDGIRRRLIARGATDGSSPIPDRHFEGAATFELPERSGTPAPS